MKDELRELRARVYNSREHHEREPGEFSSGSAQAYTYCICWIDEMLAARTSAPEPGLGAAKMSDALNTFTPSEHEAAIPRCRAPFISPKPQPSEPVKYPIPCADGDTWPPQAEPDYPCERCGKPGTLAQGGTTFTVCDTCWDETRPKDAELEPEVK